MKGVGGPLLCIGDLLNDLSEEQVCIGEKHQEENDLPSSSSSSIPPDNTLQSAHLTQLFQEHYSQLNDALSGTDHSWTALTLKLCTALETANKLVQSTNSNVRVLCEKVGEVEKIVKRGDSAVAAAKSIHLSLSNNIKSSPSATHSSNLPS
ncbi:hypothetical protein Tsubulata_022147 [Turnera subulata]|uniref:Uncharacterized protein n=1 Tax=Turnera subulata TaxID=218843 RepID=A0A9Q0J1R9_9ROSI|nr:hypothetical protein Tsubulata_022147 [Turnera subulata]